MSGNGKVTVEKRAKFGTYTLIINLAGKSLIFFINYSSVASPEASHAYTAIHTACHGGRC